MKKIYFLLLTLLVSSVSFGQVANSGFETFTGGAFDSWSTEAGATVEQETTIVNSGISSAKFTVNTITQGDTDVRQTINVEAGKTYDVSVFVYQADNGARARLYVGNYEGYSDPDMLNAWQELTFEYASSATETIDIGLRFYDIAANWTGSSVIYIDDYTVTEQVTTVPSVTITAPGDNDSFAPGTTSVDLEFVTQNIDLSTAGNQVNVTVGTNATATNVASPYAIATVDGGTYDVTVELLENNAVVDTKMVSFSVSALTTVADIAALRADVTANGTGGTYLLQSVPVVTYTRTSRNQKYIQDASAGILIDDVPGNIATTFAEADGMAGLTGGVSIFNGVLQFNPSADATLVASTAVIPEVVTIATLLTDYADYQSELVKIVGTTFTETGTFAASTDYTINDGASMVFRTNFSEADYIGQAIPTTSEDLVVLVGEFNGTPQVTARTLTDLTLSTTTFDAKTSFSVYPNPTNTGFVNITTTANEAINVTVFSILGKQVLSETINNNTLNVSTLNAGVYIMTLNQNGATTTKKLVIK